MLLRSNSRKTLNWEKVGAHHVLQAALQSGSLGLHARVALHARLLRQRQRQQQQQQQQQQQRQGVARDELLLRPSLQLYCCRLSENKKTQKQVPI